MKVVVEYDPRYDHWYVWTKPGIGDRILFMKTGGVILGSGRTREEALADARINNARGTKRKYEMVEL